MSELQKLRDKYLYKNKNNIYMRIAFKETCEAILKDVERISKPSGFIAVQEIKRLLTQNSPPEQVFSKSRQGDSRGSAPEDTQNSPTEQSVTRRKAHKQELGEEMSAPEDKKEKEE